MTTKTIEELLSPTSVEEGVKNLGTLTALATNKMKEMRAAEDNAVFRMLRDEHYELVSAKRELKSVIAKLFVGKRG